MTHPALRAAPLLFALGLLPAAALAQTAGTKEVDKPVTVSAGETKQIGVFGRVTPQCANGKVAVRLAKAAENGTVTARPGKLKRGAVQKCPELEPEVAAIFYQPKPGFTGQDAAVVEVSTEEGQVERHQYRITVE